MARLQRFAQLTAATRLRGNEMTELTHSVVIDHPVEDVFTDVSDASNDDKWELGVENSVPDRKPGVGQ